MKFPAGSILFLVLLFVPVFAESLPDAVLVPRDVYVGDIAELTLTAEIPRPADYTGETLVLSGDSLPESELLTFQRVLVRWRGSTTEVRIVFVPWITGRLSFPEIVILDTPVHPPDVTIVSLLDSHGISALEPSRPPLLIPGTTWIIYGILLGSLFVIAMSWFVATRLRRWLLTNPGRRMAVRRVRKFMRELRGLERKMNNTDDLWWYGRLSSAIRGYLGFYFYGSATAVLPLTGTELAGLSGSTQYAELIQTLFESINCVRFGGMGAPVSRAVLLESAGTLSRILEEHTDDDIS